MRTFRGQNRMGTGTRAIICGFDEDVIDMLAELITTRFTDHSGDFRRIACVFGGKRPALFLRKAIALRVGKSCFPPRIFSMDDFVDALLAETPLKNVSGLEISHLVYSIAKQCAPSIVRRRNSFAEFFPWAREIVSFIEHLDLEEIENEALLSVQQCSAIGYDIPSSVNQLLSHITEIRAEYHASLRAMNAHTRGMRYAAAARASKESFLSEYEAVLFCNFFYLHRSESRIMRDIYDSGKGVCIFQGDPRRWSVLAENFRRLGISFDADIPSRKPASLHLYQGFDLHSQVCLIREILKKTGPCGEDTVVVVPNPEALIPLLSEISSAVEHYNVSMGYPLWRSSLYSLFDVIRKAQGSRKDRGYYTPDYLDVLKHPLVKNLCLHPKGSACTRILIHKLEEVLKGEQESRIGGSLFLTLRNIEKEQTIYTVTVRTLQGIGLHITKEECREILSRLHRFLFEEWAKLGSFGEFGAQLQKFLSFLAQEGLVTDFALNLKASECFYAIGSEFLAVPFKNERYTPGQVWEIFKQRAKNAIIPISGSPLKGLQILGLFETRSLHFKNVLFLDVNESILPKLTIYEPLIPREVMLSLGLNRLEKAEEIQRYQFLRLIGQAETVHLVYEENREKEKSRFIEELLWQRQRKDMTLSVLPLPRASFAMTVSSREPRAKKTAEMVRFLKGERYSATRLNTYLYCPLQFYFQYVLGLKERKDILKDPEATHIGQFIHELLQEAFSRYQGDIPLIDEGFRRFFNKLMEEKFERTLARRMRSDAFLLKRIISNRMERFLDNEEKRKVRRIIQLEERKTGILRTGSLSFEFVYTADRIDELADGSIVVIDYKTGGANVTPKRASSLEQMELTRSSIKETLRSFQLPLYYHFTLQEFPDKEVNAELYNIRTLQRKSFVSVSDIPRKEMIMNRFYEALGSIIQELLDPAVDFTADRDERRCAWCGFKNMCR